MMMPLSELTKGYYSTKEVSRMLNLKDSLLLVLKV